VLKAYFDESFVIPNPLQPNSAGTQFVAASGNPVLTVGGELNKLASNIALGHNMAGIHYRSDYLQGVLLGEEVAIGILEDQLETYKEDYSLAFTTFNRRIRIIRKRR
jgi:hypothetical protein